MSLLLLFNQAPLSQQLLDNANQHLIKNNYRESVLLAHIAAELSADQSLTAWINTLEPQKLRNYLI